MPIQHPALSNAAANMRTSVFASLQHRIDAFRASGGELIPLHIGDTYLPPPEQATRSFGSVAELSRYQAVAGLPALRSAIAKRLSGLDGQDIEPGQVHVGCGCTHALFCAARAVLNPGDEVLVVTPYWPLIAGVLRSAGAVVVEVPLTQALYRDEGFDIVAALEQACSNRTRALYLISPNNPDGHVYHATQLAQFASFAHGHNLWVLSDEVYADYAYDRPQLSIARQPHMAARTIRSFSLSKSHGLAGARIGYVVAQPAVIDATRRISNHTVYNVPAAMQHVALAALADDAWPRDAHRHYRQARDATAAALSEHGIRHRRPHGGSFFFLEMADRLAGRPLDDLLEAAIERGVLLAPGGAFGETHQTSVRLCFTGAPLPSVVEGVARVGAALESLS